MTATMPSAGVITASKTAVWRDGRRYLWLVGLVVPTLAFAGIGMWHRTGHESFLWYAPVFVFGVGPLLDVIAGKDRVNPPEDAVPGMDKDRYYRWVTYLYLPLQYGGLVLAAYEWTYGGLGVVGRLGLVAAAGTVGGIAINTAHELGHKRDVLERRLSLVALAQTGYGHFYVEHNRGHHKRVATFEDPASGRLGESFWRFLPRSVVGSARSAWQLESDRLRLKKSRVFTVRNNVLQGWALTVLLFGGLAAAYGPAVLVFLAAQGIVGFSLLEVVNYLEHYGLARQKEASGRYEKVRPPHSWNSTALVSNISLYHLQRHSDHHTYPARRYQSLRLFEDAPQLPFGYATMIPLAWMPPVWRRVMDRRVVDHYDGDVTLTNLDPRHRDRYLARFGGAHDDPYPDETWVADAARVTPVRHG
jgi:alkane 1-monooxygenase